jgi:hypothetical protein
MRAVSHEAGYGDADDHDQDDMPRERREEDEPPPGLPG